MARKAKAEEHENLERWLVSYADFITLLFAFFVVMYSISSINEGKYRVLSDSLIAAFRSPTKTLEPIQVGKAAKSPYEDKVKIQKSPFAIRIPEMPLPWAKQTQLKGAGNEAHPSRGEIIDAVMAKTIKEEKIAMTAQQQAALSKTVQRLYDKAAPLQAAQAPGDDQVVVLKKISEGVQRALQTLIDKHLIAVRRNRLWVEVEIKDSVLYDSGQATINPKAIPVVNQLAKILAPFPNVIRVQGFTDNVPIETRLFPSNWELSTARAASVVRLLVKDGIAPPRLVAVGYGQYHPVADNKTAQGRRKNRRVVLVVLARSVDQRKVEDMLANEAPGTKDLAPVRQAMSPPPKAPSVTSKPAAVATRRPMGAAGAERAVHAGQIGARGKVLRDAAGAPAAGAAGRAGGRAPPVGPVTVEAPVSPSAGGEAIAPPIRLAPPIKLAPPVHLPALTPIKLPQAGSGHAP